MPDLRPTLVALLLGTVLVGCSDGPSSTATGGSASSTTTPHEPSPAAGSEPAPAPAPAPANSGSAIPDGSYAKTATVAEAKAMGITDQDFLSQLGKDGRTTFVYKFQGHRWSTLR